MLLFWNRKRPVRTLTARTPATCLRLSTICPAAEGKPAGGPHATPTIERPVGVGGEHRVAAVIYGNQVTERNQGIGGDRHGSGRVSVFLNGKFRAGHICGRVGGLIEEDASWTR